MEVIVSILSGALTGTVLGAVSSSLDRGTVVNPLIGAATGGGLGAAMYLPPMDSILSRASDNEVFIMLLVLGVIGAGLAMLLIGRAVSALTD